MIALSAVIVFIIGLPVVNLVHKAKKEMEEEDRQNGNGTN